MSSRLVEAYTLYTYNRLFASIVLRALKKQFSPMNTIRSDLRTQEIVMRLFMREIGDTATWESN